MSDAMSVLIADDHALVRSSLADWLSRHAGIIVTAVASNAEEALELALKHKPQVAVLDIDMPGTSVFDVARRLREIQPTTRVVFLSAHCLDRYIEDALAIQAAGYVMKGEPPASVLGAIRAAAEGGVYFSPEVQARVVMGPQGPRVSSQGATRTQLLTPREREVLGYLARGLSKKEIARAMNLSLHTVNRHATSLMTKLDIHDRVELARFAIREGLAKP